MFGLRKRTGKLPRRERLTHLPPGQRSTVWVSAAAYDKTAFFGLQRQQVRGGTWGRCLRGTQKEIDRLKSEAALSRRIWPPQNEPRHPFLPLKPTLKKGCQVSNKATPRWLKSGGCRKISPVRARLSTFVQIPRRLGIYQTAGSGPRRHESAFARRKRRPGLPLASKRHAVLHLRKVNSQLARVCQPMYQPVELSRGVPSRQPIAI